MRVGLVACAKRKLDHPAPARELYTSALFKKAAAYCEREYDRWYVLSALWGLISPALVIEPYDVTLAGMLPEARADWAAAVYAGIQDERVEGATLYLHAGGHYRRALERSTARVRAGVALPVLRFEAPLAGLGIGQQLSWYTAKGL